MPSINLDTLAGIPGVNQAAMSQKSPYACGAYAIIGAVGAHGVFPMEAALAYANVGPQPVDNKGNTAKENDYHELSAAAYKVTGILNNVGKINEAVNPELLTAGNVHNSPAAMAKVAIDLGRKAPKINMQEDGFKALSSSYPLAKARCEGVVGKANIDLKALNYTAPEKGTTHVVCVAHENNPKVLHWVAQGSDGNFYDPHDGSINNDWTPKGPRSKMGNYIFTGLWMVIS
jgi:hypothetical protein